MRSGNVAPPVPTRVTRGTLLVFSLWRLPFSFLTSMRWLDPLPPIPPVTLVPYFPHSSPSGFSFIMHILSHLSPSLPTSESSSSPIPFHLQQSTTRRCRSLATYSTCTLVAHIPHYPQGFPLVYLIHIYA